MSSQFVERVGRRRRIAKFANGLRQLLIRHRFDGLLQAAFGESIGDQIEMFAWAIEEPANSLEEFPVGQ